MIIDSHVHAWAADTALSPSRDYTPAAPAPVELLLAEMDANGVDGAVLVQPSFLGSDNGYLVRALRRFPDRLRGVAVVEPSASTALLEDLRAVGVAGLRFNLAHGIGCDFQATEIAGLLARAVAADLHIQLHVDASRSADAISAVLTAGGRLVIDHFARPDPELGREDPAWRRLLGRLAGARTHQVKLSAPYRLRGVAADTLAADLLATFGPDGLVWGSDFPWTRFEAGRSYAQCLAWMAEWIANSDDRRRVLGATAAALYGFPAEK